MSAQVRAGRESLPVPRRDSSTFIKCTDRCPFKQFNLKSAVLTCHYLGGRMASANHRKTGPWVTANVLVSMLSKGSGNHRVSYICHTIVINGKLPEIIQISPMPS